MDFQNVILNFRYCIYYNNMRIFTHSIDFKIVDWLVFNKIKGAWFKRASISNTAGALVDSIAFPTIAFGVLMPEIVILQFLAKTFGGMMWSFMLKKYVSKIQILAQ